MKFEVNDENNKFSIEINIAQIIKWVSVGVVGAVVVNKFEFMQFIGFVVIVGCGYGLFYYLNNVFED